MNLRYRLAAVEEAEEIAKWLQKRKVGEGQKFIDVFAAGVKEITTDPFRWPRFESAIQLAPDRNVRRYVLRPFPHLLLYEIRGDFVVALAVMHPSRDPSYWVDRLE